MMNVYIYDNPYYSSEEVTFLLSQLHDRIHYFAGRVINKLGKRGNVYVFDELMADGRIGAWKALQRFHREKGRSPLTSDFVGKKIYGSMLDGLRSRTTSPRSEHPPIYVSLNLRIKDIKTFFETCSYEPLEGEDYYLRDLVNKLTDRQRTVLSMVYFQEYTRTEVAAHLHLTQGQITHIISDGLTQLRLWIRQKEGKVNV